MGPSGEPGTPGEPGLPGANVCDSAVMNIMQMLIDVVILVVYFHVASYIRMHVTLFVVLY